jgi:hypothetical protein
MTQRKTPNTTADTHQGRRDAADAEAEKEDFAKPDAETAAQGGPPHERAEPAGVEPHATGRNDAEHGYSQDSGYATSGGPSKGAAKDHKAK